MTPVEAMAWVNQHCTEGTVGMLPSWQAAGVLASENRRMRERIERLRGSLKWVSGRLFDLDQIHDADECLRLCGDMEPKL